MFTWEPRLLGEPGETARKLSSPKSAMFKLESAKWAKAGLE